MSNIHKPDSHARLLDIDRAKGLAILLVVFGHVVARQPPLGNEWYSEAKGAVYSFHMAFFIFLSGIVFFLRAQPVTDFAEFTSSTRKRFMRLMPAYFLFAGIVFVGKWGAQAFVHVDNPVKGMGALLDLVLFPMQSVSSFLWYVYVLFLLSVVCLALFTMTKGRLWPLLVIGVLLQFAPPIQFLGLGQFSKYFLFFVLGGLAITFWERYVQWVDRLWIPCLIGLVFFLALGGHSGRGWIVAALLSIPALHGLCRREFIGSNIFIYLGSLTFSIYLMNTLAIGATKAVMLKFISWDGVNFVLLFFPVLFAAGVLIPIVLKKQLFPKFKWLDRITS